MKTNMYSNTQIASAGCIGKQQFSVLRIYSAIIFFFIAVTLNAQKLKNNYSIGGGIDVNCTANWHGSLYTPYITGSDRNSELSLGAVIQKRTSKVCGGRLSFSTVLSTRYLHDSLLGGYFEQKDVLQINFFSYAQYINNAPLSYSAARLEEKTSRAYETDWNSIKLSTAELGAGIEFQVNITENVAWKSRIGGTVYYHVKYKSGMYHEKIAPILNIGTGIHINIL